MIDIETELNYISKWPLPIAEILYLGYSLVFLFDNATSHSIYAKDALRIGDINKNLRDKQPYLHNSWYRENGIDKIYPINIQEPNGN